MPGQLDPIADKMYDHADAIHNTTRRIVHKTRVGTVKPIIPDWYRIMGATVTLLNNLQDIVGHIPDPDIDNDRYYDDRGDEFDPRIACTEARIALRLTRQHLARTIRQANNAWSAIGHIGLHDSTEGDHRENTTP